MISKQAELTLSELIELTLAAIAIVLVFLPLTLKIYSAMMPVDDVLEHSVKSISNELSAIISGMNSYDKVDYYAIFQGAKTNDEYALLFKNNKICYTIDFEHFICKKFLSSNKIKFVSSLDHSSNACSRLVYCKPDECKFKVDLTKDTAKFLLIKLRIYKDDDNCVLEFYDLCCLKPLVKER